MKTAVVTGASGGIGLETARALLADGWQVVCLSRHACPLEGVRSIPCDITDSVQVQAAFAAVDRVDLLVNTPGSVFPARWSAPGRQKSRACLIDFLDGSR